MRLSEILLSAVVAVALLGCAGGDDPIDGENDDFVGDKTDGFCVEEGSVEAKGVMLLVNDVKVDIDELDNEAELNRTAAENIVGARPLSSLQALDAVPFVGPVACERLKKYADAQGYMDRVGGPLVCADIVDASGRPGGADVGAGLHDPIANLVLREGSSCPQTFSETMAKLRETDTERCSGGRDGIASMFVSERGQVTGKVESGRVVTTRACGGRGQQDLFFSLFGVSASSRALPEDAEVMAFDEISGVYNYYTLESGQWSFHGNSHDMIAPGATTRCASCHTGGGPIMKELDTPWLHWEGHEPTPGANDLINKFEDLGQHSDGAELEFLVKQGNRVWNERRVRNLRSNGTVQQLLRPLFCTVEVNLDNGADFRSEPNGDVGQGDDLRSIPGDFLVDPGLLSFGSVPMPAETYRAAIVDANQRIMTGAGSQLQGPDGQGAVDTIFDFVFPERAFADRDYLTKLRNEGIVDTSFIEDVLIVDFTRPIFSDARCELLSFAPELGPDDRTPDKLRAGFVANLEAAAPSAGSPAGQLLTHLTTSDDGQAHKAAVTAFLDACKARDAAAFMADAMKIVSKLRNQARGLSLFEFAETMPFDDLSVSASAHLDPATCELR